MVVSNIFNKSIGRQAVKQSSAFTKKKQKVKLVDQDKNPILDKRKQKKLCHLLPAHNEELIIAVTIRSAVAAGQNIEDIQLPEIVKSHCIPLETMMRAR